MPYTFRYGSPFQVPAAGAALAQGAREQTDFQRIMKNNEVRLQEREQELQEARLNLELQRLQQQEEQADRQFQLKRKREKRLQRAQQIESQLQKQREQRLQRKMEWQMDQAGIERASEERQQVREEINRLRQQGAVPADADVERPPESYRYEDPTGQTWYVPKVPPEQQLQKQTMLREERNKLRKWGARKVQNPGQVGEDEFLWRDAQGQPYAVPRANQGRMGEEMRDTRISALESKRSSLQRMADNISQNLTNYQKRKQQLNEQIRQKKRTIESEHLTNMPEKKKSQVKKRLETLQKQKKQIDGQIRKMPDPGDIRKQVRSINDQIDHLSRGGIVRAVTGVRQDATSSNQETGNTQSSQSGQARSEEPQSDDGNPETVTVVADKYRGSSPGYAETEKMLNYLFAANPDKSKDEVYDMAFREGYLQKIPWQEYQRRHHEGGNAGQQPASASTKQNNNTSNTRTLRPGQRVTMSDGTEGTLTIIQGGSAHVRLDDGTFAIYDTDDVTPQKKR